MICGIIGAAVLGGFGLILAQNDYWMRENLGYFGWGGYIFGSLGFVGWCAEQQKREEQEEAQRQILASMQRPAPPERQHLPLQSREPVTSFEYASWDDEEPRS